MRLTDTLSNVLGAPSAYRIFTRLVGGKVWRNYLDEYVKPVERERVLDIGCGPADILSYLPHVDYTGLDISPEYIAAAKTKFGSQGRFLCGDIGTVTIEREHGTFNLVLATGVLHHLDDERAVKLFELARVALAPGGRLVTYDGCFTDGQSQIARWLLKSDRGKHVRKTEDYQRLASHCFSRIQPSLRHDLLRVPYTHLIMRCSNAGN
jgi:SAM-dependent methyltransferase